MSDDPAEKAAPVYCWCIPGSPERPVTMPHLKSAFCAGMKNVDYPCPTKDCPGDARYRPPGRGHRSSCSYGHVPPPGEGRA